LVCGKEKGPPCVKPCFWGTLAKRVGGRGYIRSPTGGASSQKVALSQKERKTVMKEKEGTNGT